MQNREPTVYVKGIVRTTHLWLTHDPDAWTKSPNVRRILPGEDISALMASDDRVAGYRAECVSVVVIRSDEHTLDNPRR